MKLITIIICVAFGYNIVGFSQVPTLNHSAFTSGEEVTYKIYYNWKFVWVPTGEVTFTTFETDSTYEIKVVGLSYPSYDSVFKVRDNYVSRIDKINLKPINFRRDIEEGSYIRFDSMQFFHTKFKVEEYFGVTHDKVEFYEFDIDENVLDMVSAIYLVRGMNFNSINNNTVIPFKIFFDKELLDLDIRFIGSKKCKMKKVGKIDSWHLQADLIGGNIFNIGDVMDIWVSKDGNNIPLQVESPIKYGTIKAVLKSVKGSKYKFNFPK